jgi:serine O-acetyltransferase
MNPSVTLYRVGNWFYRNNQKRIGFAISWLNRLLFAAWIPSSATIGKRFVCGYWGLGVVIHKNAIIGNDCTISQNVTIGRSPTNDGVPTIGSGVYIAPGSVISGAIKVGDYSVIGANSVVIHDVPEGVLVVGAPARIVRKLSIAEIDKFSAR